MFKHDLDHTDFNPPDCPEWARETLPESIRYFRGRNGMPSPYNEKKYAFAMNVRGIDRYHANQFIVCRKETEEYLYSQYTPIDVRYVKGTLPFYEKLAEKVTEGLSSDMEKALALLFNGVRNSIRHPMVPPFGQNVGADRNLDDESLLASGSGWCNEQARVFVRLCQVSGIPARIVQLFYSDKKSGHCISEFYADKRWCMADATWSCVFPDADGKLLSAAQCHDRADGQKYCGLGYHRRFLEMIKLAAELNVVASDIPLWKLPPEELTGRMNYFGIINYPLNNQGKVMKQ